MPRRLIGTRARVWGLTSAVGVVVLAWTASANGAPFELEWSAPEGCPSREQIVEATHADLGDSGADAPPELFVQGAVLPVTGGFVVTLALKDATGRAVGEREVRVERPSCPEILKPASVVLAMMIAVARPDVAERRGSREFPQAPSAPGQSPAPPSPAGPITSPVPPRPVISSSPEPSPHRFSIGASGVASLGALPDVGLGVTLRALYLPRSIALIGVEASFEAGGSRQAAGGEVAFQLFRGSLQVGLPVVRSERFELIPMVTGSAGVLRTLPTGYALVQDELRPALYAGVGVLARAHLTKSLFVDVLLEGERILRRDRLRIREGDKLNLIFQPSPFGGRLSAGIAYEFH